jgi:hypothetical protein
MITVVVEYDRFLILEGSVRDLAPDSGDGLRVGCGPAVAPMTLEAM